MKELKRLYTAMDANWLYTTVGITTQAFPAISISDSQYAGGYDYRDREINQLREMINSLQAQVDELKPRGASSINLDETTRKLPLPLE